MGNPCHNEFTGTRNYQPGCHEELFRSGMILQIVPVHMIFPETCSRMLRTDTSRYISIYLQSTSKNIGMGQNLLNYREITIHSPAILDPVECSIWALYMPYICLIYGRYLQSIGSWNGHWPVCWHQNLQVEAQRKERKEQAIARLEMHGNRAGTTMAAWDFWASTYWLA